MDGVLVDFDRGFKRLKLNPDHLKPDEYEKKHGKHSIWNLIDKRGVKFWKRLPWMGDGRELWDYIKRYDPIVLSAPSKSGDSIEGKMYWLRLNLGLTQVKPTRKPEDFDQDTRIILSNNKAAFVKSKYDILIDDNKLNLTKWSEAGGTGIFHNDATDTIKILEEIMSGNSSSDETAA
jgi:5'(3')-deoxyribonucleotidase